VGEGPLRTFFEYVGHRFLERLEQAQKVTAFKKARSPFQGHLGVNFPSLP
jgi:hypothetical protein